MPPDPVGISILALQCQLKLAGYYHSELDGIFGRNTRAAIDAYYNAEEDSAPLPPVVQRMSPEGRKLIERSEGRRNHMYMDSGGAPTTGIGHLLTRSELRSGKIMIDGVATKWRDGLSDAEVNSLFAQDVERFEECVSETLPKVPLQTNEFEALVSFAYNVGCEAFAKSTLVKKLQAGQSLEVPAQLRRWVYDGGKRVAGLENRREAEIAHWSGAVA